MHFIRSLEPFQQDVRYDLFHKDYINGRSEKRENGDKICEDGLRICKMVSGGKVHILYNGGDYALNAGSWNPYTFITRIGEVGSGMKRNWWGKWVEANVTHPDIKDKIANKSCNEHLPLHEKFSHSYHFNKFAVEYYQEHHI